MTPFPFSKIWLASQSPRRRQLLEGLGLTFDTIVPDIDEENYPAEMPKADVPVYLAQQKARAVRACLQQRDELIIASDTIVLMDEVIYPKPMDLEDGIRILRALQGRTHQVVTGVCLMTLEREEAFADTALVHFAPMTDTEILYYLEQYRPYDKAGAYAIQEWIGLAKIIKMEGAYTTVMGLPTHCIYERLTGW